MIIAVLGRAGSGKTTVSAILAARLGCEYIDTSKVVEEVSTLSKGKQGRKALQKVHLKQEDPDWLATPLIERAQASLQVDEPRRLCIVTGIREPYLLYRLQEIDEALVFSIKVNPYMRYCRLCTRDGFISVDDFQISDNGDKLLGLDITFESTHRVIDGEQALENVINDIEVVLFQHGVRSHRKLGEF